MSLAMASVASELPPTRPQRRPKRSHMSFRSLPPLPQPPPPPATKPALEERVKISNCSIIILEPKKDCSLTASSAVMHRKWVKLRHCMDSACSASSVRFRFHCANPWALKNNGCEVQEVSAWIEDYEYIEGE